MKNLFLYLSCILLILTSFGMLKIKYGIINFSNDLKVIESNINEDKQAIHILKAEWAYLNNPVRIESLANKYLDLQYIASSQVRYNQDIGSNKYKYANNKGYLKSKPVLKPILSSAKVRDLLSE